MYLPAHFAESRPEVLRALMAAHPLAAVVVQAGGELLANHLPLMFEHGAGADAEPGVLRGHVARANPLWSCVADGQPVLAIFQGPQAYISPNWYPTKQEHGKVVPTWNYCTVHVHGSLHVHDDVDWVHDLVSRLTDRHEASQARPWAAQDAPADYLQALLRNIVGIEIRITRLEGKWKMSQNQPAANRLGAQAGLRSSAQDAERHGAVADLIAQQAPPGA